MTRESRYQILNYFILTLGVLLLVIVWWQQRGFFIDEANLGRNIMERDVAGLFSTLDHQQYCPPFLLVIIKGVSLIFGSAERSLRLISLLLAIGSLVVLFQIVKKEFAEDIRWFPLALVALSPVFIRYGTELKQYGPDAFFTLMVVFLLQKHPVESWDYKKSLAAGILGSVLVWLSMPSIFLLAGLGAWKLWETFHSKQEYKGLLAFLFPITFSFGLYYVWLISSSIEAPNLEPYHGRFFLPIIPQNMEDLSLLGNLILIPFQTALGSTTVEILIGIVLTLSGIYVLAKKRWRFLFLLFLPILITLLASSLKLYSLRPRLILFFIPLMVLIMTYGLSWIWLRFSRLRIVFVALTLVIFVNWKPWQFVTQRFEVEELKKSLNFICNGDYESVYVDKFAVPTFRYYIDHTNEYRNCFTENWNMMPKENLEKLVIYTSYPGVLNFVYGAMTADQLDKKKEDLSVFGIIEDIQTWTGATLITVRRPD